MTQTQAVSPAVANPSRIVPHGGLFSQSFSKRLFMRGFTGNGPLSGTIRDGAPLLSWRHQ